jgi:SAM-dependent methyltransferase
MNPYGPILSRLYDRFWSTYARNAAPILREFFEKQNVYISYPAVLDLGCGTGQLAFHFLESGCTVTGLDLSADMLFWARRNCLPHLKSGRAAFYQVDIRSFRLDQAFGLALSTYNTLNHLPPEDHLGCFRSTFSCLVPGGWVLFDLNTKRGLREWGDEETREGPNGPLTVHRSFDDAANRGRMEVEGRWGQEVFSETVLNYARPVEDALHDLRSAGFGSAYAALADDLDKPISDPEVEKRIFLVGTKKPN